MSFITYENFTGKDLRKLNVRGDTRTCRVAKNLDLTTGGGYRVRDALRKVCVVSSESVGLYSIGGHLRCAIPSGHDIQATRPAFVLYDPVGNGVAYPTGLLAKLHKAEVIGADALTGVFPYLVLERTDGKIEHHWIRESPYDGTAFVSSQIHLPFVPGKPLVKFNGRLWAADQVNGAVRFSSIFNGPTDWLSELDAGDLPVLQYATGTRTITGLGFYNDLLAVYFGDSVQLYDAPPNPALHALRKVLAGAGTVSPNTLQNVLGDLFYVSRGGFRSLSVANQIGEFREGDIGANVQAETDDLSITDPEPTALWSQARSQYLCAFGNKVYVYTFSALTGVKGWTTWELPVTVEYMVEEAGVLYVRAEDTIYKFDPNYDTDEGQSEKIAFELTPQFTDLKDPGREKMIDSLEVIQEGRSEVRFLVDPRRLDTYVQGPVISGLTTSLDRISADFTTKALAVQFTGNGRWQIDSFSLQYRTLLGA